MTDLIHIYYTEDAELCWNFRKTKHALGWCYGCAYHKDTTPTIKDEPNPIGTGSLVRTNSSVAEATLCKAMPRDELKTMPADSTSSGKAYYRFYNSRLTAIYKSCVLPTATASAASHMISSRSFSQSTERRSNWKITINTLLIILDKVAACTLLIEVAFACLVLLFLSTRRSRSHHNLFKIQVPRKSR